MAPTMNGLFGAVAIVLALNIAPVNGQQQGTKSTTVWGSVVVATFGDRVPLLSPNNSVLTPLGANQLYSVGDFFRSRYIGNDTTTAIPGIASDVMDLNQVQASAVWQPWFQQSAQAFLDGLYPPLQSLNAGNSSLTLLSNGSNIEGPLNGVQYGSVYTASTLDPNSLFLYATLNCPAYTEAVSTYYTKTSAFASLKQSTSAFYNSLAPVFSTAIAGSAVDYGNAYDVWDYLAYEMLHNSSIARDSNYYLSLNQARYYADAFAAATVGNASNAVLSIAGRAMSNQILGSLYDTINARGQYAKMTALFTSWEPLMSFAALLNLPAAYPSFLGMLNPGSSMAVELYSQTSNTTFPTDVDDLYVRVLWRNGSDASAVLTDYTIGSIDNGGSNGGVPFTDFVNALEGFALSGPGQWCSMCGSSAVFCPYYLESDSGSSGSGSSASGSSGHALSPVVAGVIGALVTLAVLGLLLIALMLLLGLRFRRDSPSVLAGKQGAAKKRRNDLGGFKGSEKLASDVDLPKSGAPVGASVVPVQHARTGSWEMKEGELGERGVGRDSQMTAVSAVGEGIGAKVVKDEDEEGDGLGHMKAVETRESF